MLLVFTVPAALSGMEREFSEVTPGRWFGEGVDLGTTEKTAGRIASTRPSTYGHRCGGDMRATICSGSACGSVASE
ncbi:hypothetical protein ACIHFD_11020 [Nonomuraea sp. NPDC051941]|uniref:hypothetical protein n=1 Tax=Nonomuraea sp. NPDC051941 TaxID=3364373 RepID=UPI0037C5F2F5